MIQQKPVILVVIYKQERLSQIVKKKFKTQFC
jgi:hypothetical protein